MNTVTLEVRQKNESGPTVQVDREPQAGAWFELYHVDRWYRGHVTDITYRYTSEAGIDATLRVIVTIDAVTWAVADADLRQLETGETS